MLADARGWGALLWAHKRFLPVQRAGCSWMLVEGVLPHGPASASYLCSAQDARGCSWMGRSPMDSWAIPVCSAHRMLVDGARSLAHERPLPVQRTGCLWMLLNAAHSLTHGPISDSHLFSAQDARGGSWMGCSPTGPRAIPTCATSKVLVDARGRGAVIWTHERFLPMQRTGCSRMLVEGCSPMGP